MNQASSIEDSCPLCTIVWLEVRSCAARHTDSGKNLTLAGGQGEHVYMWKHLFVHNNILIIVKWHSVHQCFTVALRCCALLCTVKLIGNIYIWKMIQIQLLCEHDANSCYPIVLLCVMKPLSSQLHLSVLLFHWWWPMWSFLVNKLNCVYSESYTPTGALCILITLSTFPGLNPGCFTSLFTSAVPSSSSSLSLPLLVWCRVSLHDTEFLCMTLPLVDRRNSVKPIVNHRQQECYWVVISVCTCGTLCTCAHACHQNRYPLFYFLVWLKKIIAFMTNVWVLLICFLDS